MSIHVWDEDLWDESTLKLAQYGEKYQYKEHAGTAPIAVESNSEIIDNSFDTILETTPHDEIVFSANPSESGRPQFASELIGDSVRRYISNILYSLGE